jgi:hypothetical protein
VLSGMMKSNAQVRRQYADFVRKIAIAQPESERAQLFNEAEEIEQEADQIEARENGDG